MVNFSLELSINSDDLKIIKAALLKITLAKLVRFEINVSRLTSTETCPNLTWLVLEPFEINQIEWSEEYSIYASSQIELINGTVISKTSQTTFPANDAYYYSFTSNAIFSEPFTGSGTPPPGSYKVNNNMPYNLYPALSFGLQQKASINGSLISPTPVNVAVVPATFPITFTPSNIIYVWLQTPLISGTLIDGLPENSTEVTFSGNLTKVQLKYDPKTGKFLK